MHVYVMGIHMLSLKLTFFFNLNFEFKKKTHQTNKQTKTQYTTDGVEQPHKKVL